MHFPNRDSIPFDLIVGGEVLTLTPEEKALSEKVAEEISNYIRHETRRETLNEFVLAANDYSDFEKIDVPYHVISEQSQTEEDLNESFSWLKLVLQCKATNAE